MKLLLTIPYSGQLFFDDPDDIGKLLTLLTRAKVVTKEKYNSKEYTLEETALPSLELVNEIKFKE